MKAPEKTVLLVLHPENGIPLPLRKSQSFQLSSPWPVLAACPLALVDTVPPSPTGFLPAPCLTIAVNLGAHGTLWAAPSEALVQSTGTGLLDLQKPPGGPDAGICLPVSGSQGPLAPLNSYTEVVLNPKCVQEADLKCLTSSQHECPYVHEATGSFCREPK